MAVCQRLSNYELLRIISMVLIVVHHFALHSHWDFKPEDKSIRRNFIETLASGGKMGVNLFMMLTGYFHAGRPAKILSVVRTWIQVLFYSWGIFFILYFQRPMWYDDVMSSIMPVFFFGYWFVTTYMVVMLLSPALGKMAANLTNAEYIGLLSVLFTTMCVLNYSFSYTYSHVFYFTFLYLLGSYLRLFSSVYSKVKARTYFMILLFLTVFNFSTIYYFSVHEVEWVNHHGGAYFLMNSNSAPLSLVFCIFIFLFVETFEFFNGKVNAIGNVSFGIYLIHDNRFLRPLIWEHWVRGKSHYDKPEFYMFCIFAPAMVYVICGAIDWIRQRLLGAYEVKLATFIERVVLTISDYLSHCLKLNGDGEYTQITTV